MKIAVHRPSTTHSALAGRVASSAPVARSQSDRHGGVLTAIVLAILGAAAVAILPAPAEAAELPVQTVIYGIAEDQNIYTIDPATGLVTGSTSTASLNLVGDLANAFALDRAKSQIYFMANTVSGSNSLFFWDQPSNTFGVAATAAELGVSAMQRNASFYDGKYWWIGINDNNLYSAQFNYTAGLPSGVVTTSTFAISGVSGTFSLNPNDIAINPITQTLYGSDTIAASNGSGDFFSISLANLASPLPYTKLYEQPSFNGAQVGVQLAYNDDYSTLYGQNYVTGEWFEVSTASAGTFTPTGGTTTEPSLKMRDLAGGVQAVPEPGSLSLASCGLVLTLGLAWRQRRGRRSGAPRAASLVPVVGPTVRPIG